MDPVKRSDPPRSRRAERAEQTRLRIVDAATELFEDPGYALATIETIAARADVAVETVYSRFGSKANLLDAILGPAITGTVGDSSLFDRPEFAEIRGSKDQREQIQLMAHFSRTILERTYRIHRILHTAASVDPNAAELQRRDHARRVETQKSYISQLRKNGPLRPGLTAADAADTYSALANPANYAFLTGDRGWTPDRFQEWLGDSLTRLLL